MTRLYAALFLILFSFTTTFAGTQVTVDLTELPADVQNTILNIQKKQDKLTSNFNEKAIEKYASIGKMLAVAMKEFCQTIGVEVNEFIKTPAGKIVTALLIWKYIGSDLTTLGMGTAAYIFLVILALFLIKIFTLPKKVYEIKLSEDGKSRVKIPVYVQRFTFDSRDDDSNATTKLLIAIFGLALIIVMTLCWYVKVLP